MDCTSYWRNQTDDEPPDLDEEVDNDPSCIGGCGCSICANGRSEIQLARLQMWKTYDDIDPLKIDNLTLEAHNTHAELGIDSNHRYLICTHVLGGLNLKTRNWGVLPESQFFQENKFC